MANVIERIIGTSAERATQRIERARAELAKIEQQLEERRQARDRALLDDAPVAVLAAVRGEIASMEQSRLYAMEDLTAAEKALALAEQAAAARALASKVATARKILAEREAIAAEADTHIAALAGISAKCEALFAQAAGLLPGVAGEARQVTLRSAISDQLGLLSGGTLAEDAHVKLLRDLNRQRAAAGRPLRNEVLNVAQTAARQHRQILASQPAQKEAA